ncbi:MAG: hypothetical protein A2W90_21655 [Bacteroidetes bacterium GWF2_42_66]|nr:MAG: hypothetical protein A2W92_04465 [Bacteroidetes bacterium GWA2_42_15]OFY03298.1 MAG: hypothetical protein A2W89_19205 [Bacteroidetes bacterium GWE2_42_39]OFY45652.1 MAG: hypothetical protein A2W90_21655 [Bacteroidetes bacterium GWF2_42_66]HBL77366.1 hypothetical protein [Prolixibacteraceae bacterium]HCU62524.1 hypothetical protein [Prolixibacteraceae bacterium]
MDSESIVAFISYCFFTKIYNFIYFPNVNQNLSLNYSKIINSNINPDLFKSLFYIRTAFLKIHDVIEKVKKMEDNQEWYTDEFYQH